MIRFFIKKSSPNESRNNLQKESLHDSEDFSLAKFQSYLICQKWNEWLDSSSNDLRPMNPEEISEKKIILEYFSLGDPQSYLIWQERNGWFHSSPKNLRQMNEENIKEDLQDSEDFLLGNFQSYFSFQKWNEWLDSSPNDLSSNDSRRNIWKEDYFRIFLFRRSSIIFDLAGREWIIRFFIKKSSPNESRKNL